MSSTVWQQLGQDIDGEDAGDWSGTSVSMNADGTRVAIGAIGNDSGHVRVYEYNTSTSSWSKIGQDIDGEAVEDTSGYSVSMSANGSRVAIGALNNDDNGANSGHVRVYEYINSTWTQMGSDINGEATGDRSGISVSMNANGTRVAIGADLNDGNGINSGHVRVYEYNGLTSSWSQMGADIDGEASNNYSGYPVSLNADGTRVAIGAPYNNGTSVNSGHVRVYEYNGLTSSWSQMGADIDGEAAGDYSGVSVSMNGHGTCVAIGALNNDDNGANSGHVRVYEYINSTWTQIGQDINGEASNDQSGFSVSMNENGTRVAIGAIGNDGNGTDSGHVRVYEYNTSTSSWSKIGQDIDGEDAGDTSGYSVSMSADGTRVAIGALYNDSNGVNSGHVRIYSLPTSAPAPASHNVEVNLNIAVNASGTINVFGKEPVAPLNVIVADVELPAAALYSAENSMFEFWEPSSARDTRLAQLAVSEGRNWKLLTRKLANGIQDCLEGEFDATLASPFNAAKYTAAVHKEAANFGELALRSYAHYTLGHIDATAAITNDVAFVQAMLAREASRGAEGVEDDFASAVAGTKACANLANLLVKAIAEKNGAGSLAIAEQVLGQDASRAMDEDNNELTVDKKQALKFIAGDIIYMNIQLQKPDVVIAPTGQKVSDTTLEDKFAALGENYTLKITLS